MIANGQEAQVTLIIFDCDGVLVDSEPITNRAISENLRGHGLDVTPEWCMENFVGGTIAGVGQQARALGADLPEDWVARMYEEIFDVLARGMPEIPGAGAAVSALQDAGFATCVASNGPRRKMDITLTSVGMFGRFAGRIYSAHEVGIPKPAPGLFLHAARVHETAPSACIVIEDSPSGARAARSAGMRCLARRSELPEARLEAEGAVLFDRMSDLPDLIKEMVR
ncbi:MAG: HAD-IA family hydrolase [Pseudomonadota bacterium]